MSKKTDLDIKGMYDSGAYSPQSLADELGVDVQQVLEAIEPTVTEE